MKSVQICDLFCFFTSNFLEQKKLYTITVKKIFQNKEVKAINKYKIKAKT